MRRVIERIESRSCLIGEPVRVDVTARDIAADDIYGEAYTFMVEGAEAVAKIYAEAKG